MTPAEAAQAANERRKIELDVSGAEWQHAPGDEQGVQIAFVDGYIAMRNGAEPDGPSLIFTPAEWRAFVLGARDGEFDLQNQPPQQ
ncbi:DUF397 domain-containing protein [Kitasatospora sp. NA04385]|uniref:DUF397 domain-containing protein n=1 Tax=Kitasatospora sp. NA04385 TaxID=2742135 RepID=UPI00159175E7|nr:DUF397 domain-containing protein [Kitasatospora sp. NA04385]QKW18814.1 DUF397 domain-containing protein [Kitasatospora sp. NA04385]